MKDKNRQFVSLFGVGWIQLSLLLFLGVGLIGLGYKNYSLHRVLVQEELVLNQAKQQQKEVLSWYHDAQLSASVFSELKGWKTTSSVLPYLIKTMDQLPEELVLDQFSYDRYLSLNSVALENTNRHLLPVRFLRSNEYFSFDITEAQPGQGTYAMDNFVCLVNNKLEQPVLSEYIKQEDMDVISSNHRTSWVVSSEGSTNFLWSSFVE